MKKKTNAIATQSAALMQTNDDFKTALVIVSVGVNVAVLTAWLVAQMSSEYASQLSSLI